MSQKVKSTKRSPRQHPCKPRGVPSKGLRQGAKRTRLSYATRVLMGGGRLDSIEPVEVRTTFGRWMADRQRMILGER